MAYSGDDQSTILDVKLVNALIRFQRLMDGTCTTGYIINQWFAATSAIRSSAHQVLTAPTKTYMALWNSSVRLGENILPLPVVWECTEESTPHNDYTGALQDPALNVTNGPKIYINMLLTIWAKNWNVHCAHMQQQRKGYWTDINWCMTTDLRCKDFAVRAVTIEANTTRHITSILNRAKAISTF